MCNMQSLENEKAQMLLQVQSPGQRSGSASEEPIPTPRSPTSAALFEHDLHCINEQTQTLLADKLAAEQRYGGSAELAFNLLI